MAPETNPFRKRLAALERERSTWMAHWRELSEHFLPRRGRFLSADRNRGDKRNTRIINAAGIDAARTLASGMMAGLTSPARPWFKLATPDPALAEFEGVKAWLEAVQRRINGVFARSNVYQSLPLIYAEMAVSGSAAASLVPDFGNVIRTKTFTAGEYMMATNDKDIVDSFYREFEVTVGQLVTWFGRDKVSPQVRDLWDRGELDKTVEVGHAVEPNDGRMAVPLRGDAPFVSVYWERGAEEGRYLEVRGFARFPVLTPRWAVMSGDVYGRSPGMDALGDAKQLQKMESRKLKGLDKWVDPAMVGPAALKNQRASILPGDITYVDVTQGGQTFAPAYQVDPGGMGYIRAEIAAVEARIRRLFYADLFLMLTLSDRREITAREVEERHAEKLLMLGPVLEQLNTDLLDPLIEGTFQIMFEDSKDPWARGEDGLLPLPPQELAGVELKVEYISILHAAQKSVGASGLVGLAGFAASLAGAKPEVLDKIDGDQMIDEYAEMVGVPARVVLGDGEVAELRQAKARQAQLAAAAQLAETAKTGAEAAKSLSETDLGGRNVLERLTGV